MKISNINNKLCISIKNKKSVIQCTFKRKINEEYCGRHLTVKKKIRFDNLISCIKIQSLFRGWKIRTMFFINNSEIKNCINDTDFQTLDDINMLSPYNLFIYEDIIYPNTAKNSSNILINDDNIINNSNECNKSSNIKYAFDIYSFEKLLTFNNIKNPYNRNKISQKNINYANMKIKWLKQNNMYKKPFEGIEFNDEEKIRNKIINVFHNYECLGYIINIEWFEKLSFFKLRLLYEFMEEFWNYRSEIPFEEKVKIIDHNNNPFKFRVYDVRHFSSDRERKMLQNIILDIFNRFVTEGENETHRISGSLIMLSAFVLVCREAAHIYPDLVQLL